MRILLYMMLLNLGLTACALGPKSVDKPGSPNLVSQAGNEDEYELTIIDPGFQTWFATNSQPIAFHSPQYYAQQNRNYVQQWNRLADQGAGRRSRDYPFENRIDYQPNVDYGIELNYELYWYFRYVERFWGQQYGFGFGRRNSVL